MKTSFHSGKLANDYYSFGSPMPGRNFNSPDYRYGFNGMEKDDEVKGNGNSYDFGDRIYDPRIGRWLTVDPFACFYPALSPYNYAANNPIHFTDPSGGGVFPSAEELKKAGTAAINNPNFVASGKTTYCNFGLQAILHASLDYSMDGMKANDMGVKLRDNAFATEVSASDAIQYANMGVTIIASYVAAKNDKGEYVEPGHVATVAPGPQEDGVQLYNIGKTNGLLSQGGAFGEREVKYFILNADLDQVNKVDQIARYYEESIQGTTELLTSITDKFFSATTKEEEKMYQNLIGQVQQLLDQQKLEYDQYKAGGRAGVEAGQPAGAGSSAPAGSAGGAEKKEEE